MEVTIERWKVMTSGKRERKNKMGGPRERRGKNRKKNLHFSISRKVIGERFRSLQCEWTKAGRSAHN